MTVLGRTLGRTDVFRLREEIGFVDARAGGRFAPPPHGRARSFALAQRRRSATSPSGVSPAERERADHLLGLFGLARIVQRRFADCSHGERTRCLIARALVPRPRLLLLDEPGSGLDLPGRETLLAALDRLVDDDPGLALVATTHHLEELPASTTHALLLRGGETVARGPAATTLSAETLSSCFGLPSVGDPRAGALVGNRERLTVRPFAMRSRGRTRPTHRRLRRDRRRCGHRADGAGWRRSTSGSPSCSARPPPDLQEARARDRRGG